MNDVDCCDPQIRAEKGHHAPDCTDPASWFDDRVVALSVACPKPQGCGQHIGTRCVTPQGYGAKVHAVRVLVARGGTPKPVAAGGRPSHTQADILAAALAHDGVYMMCGYQLHGVDRLKRSMKAMVDKGWFTFVTSHQHEDEYRITDDGRAAHGRYDMWMNGGRG